jgi:hypothetical protein
MTAIPAPGPGQVPADGRPGRLLRLEVRRSPAWILLPLLAALLWIASPYGRSLKAPVVLWSSRSLALQGSLQVIGPFAAGIAAWAASREARRNLTDLLTSTARSRWSRRLAALAATASWAMALYALAGVALFGLTARQATWGGPVWWPVAVGAVAVLAFTAAGFAVGVVAPSRFTAPLLAIGLLLVLQVSLALQASASWVSPVRDSVNAGASVFFGVDPSLAITQIIFLSGVTAAAVGVMALPPGAAAGWWAKRAGRPGGAAGTRAGGITAGILAAGVAAAATGVVLASTAREQGPQGAVVPALHDAAAARPVRYTPVCDAHGPVPVCVHPAYRSLLSAIAGDLAPVTGQVAGLPGAPVRVVMATPNGSSSVLVLAATMIGHPPVLYLGPFVNTQGPMTPAEVSSAVRKAAANAITGLAPIGELKGASLGPAQSAQLSVALGLGLIAGQPARPGAPPAVVAAAHRFAALPAPARHAWLAAHLPALQAGHLTLADLP